MKTHLNVSKGRILIAVVAVALCLERAASAVTLTITPSAISNDYRGVVTLQVGGLTNGESVTVGKFGDGDGDGLVSTNDWLLQGFRVTDGKAKTISGATNYNVPYDQTGTNGEITTWVSYLENGPNHLVGQQLFIVRGSSGTATNTLTLTNWPYSQTITGAIQCSGTNVPYAGVVLLTPEPGGDMTFGAGVMADSAGNYSVHMPPGVYMPLPFRPGFVADMSAAPVIALTPGVTVATNVDLLLATRLLSGRVVDAGDTNTGLPGVFLIVESPNGHMAISSANSNGVFNIPVTAGLWRTEVDDASLTPLGYVRLENFPVFDTTAGDVTNALIQIPKGTAMFYGTIKTDSNAPLVAVRFYGSDSNHVYGASGVSDPNGNYSVAVLPGTWSVGLDDDNPALAGYVVGGGTNGVGLSTNQALRVDFLAKRTAATISGWVKDNTSNPVVGLYVYAHADSDGSPYNQSAQTDAAGNYSLNVAHGSWHVGLSCWNDDGLENLGYECVNERVVSVPPTNAVANFTVYPIGTPRLDPPVFTSPGQLAFALYGRGGTNYVVQVSTNLAEPSAWSTLANFAPTSSVYTVWDNQATNEQRFYRVKIGP